MSRTPSVRTFAAHEWRTYRDLRLRALADSPDAFEATLAQAQARPDADWRGRLEAGTASGRDLPLVAEVEAEPLGLAWGRQVPPELEAVHVYQMWVDAGARRLGAGRMLLDTIITWATAANARCVVLGVTLGDTPAARLYARAGFQAVGEPGHLRPGSPLLGQAMQLELRPPDESKLASWRSEV
jgi:ribosomal protein S18 acetylase RimI-like enzyme